MRKDEFELTININTKTFFIFVFIILMVLATSTFLLMRSSDMFNSNKGLSVLKIQPVSAAEIYPHFICTCCGMPLDKNNMCCGIAEDMVAYIDSKVVEDLTEDEVLVSTVKKYGLKSLASESEKDEIKNILAASAPDDSPVISLETNAYDFGDVSQANGVVSHSFVIENTGKSELILNNLLSSCGCTSAAIVSEGQEGPRFSMHNNPTDWTVNISPGASAELKVYYDPNVHPDFRGKATREVTVFSNDPVNFEKSIKIKLNQVD